MINRFIDNGDGTITDTRTQLMWESNHSNELFAHEDAITYCYKLRLGGYTDWRIPEVWELVSIVDYTRFMPAIYPVFKLGYSTFYWTEPLCVPDIGGAWSVDFEDGEVDYGNVISKLYVRAVRNVEVK